MRYVFDLRVRLGEVFIDGDCFVLCVWWVCFLDVTCGFVLDVLDVLVGLFVMVCFLEGLFVDTFDYEPTHDDLSQFRYFGRIIVFP